MFKNPFLFFTLYNNWVISIETLGMKKLVSEYQNIIFLFLCSFATIMLAISSTFKSKVYMFKKLILRFYLLNIVLIIFYYKFYE